MATEVEIGFAWIESTLSGDVTLQGLAPGGVFQTFQLPGITTPYVLVTYQPGGGDQVVFGGSRAYADMRFQVVVAGPFSSLQTIQDAAARVDTLLTLATQTAVTGGTIIASFRDQPMSSDEYVDSQKWHTTGGEYRVMAKAS